MYLCARRDKSVLCAVGHIPAREFLVGNYVDTGGMFPFGNKLKLQVEIEVAS